MGKRGLGSMDPEKRRLIQSMGGRACPAELRTFSRDRVLAVSAARLGGQAAKAARRAKRAAVSVEPVGDPVTGGV